MMLLREYSTFIYAQKGAHQSEKMMVQIFGCACARLSCLPRYLFIQGKETRTVQVEKEARERAPRMAPAESFFPDEKGKPPPPIQRRLY
jgi:hypothetical protein